MSEQPEQPVDSKRPRQVPVEGAPGWVIDQRKGLFAPGATFNEKVIGYQENIHLPPPPPPMPLDQALALLAELPLDHVPPPQTLPQPHRMRNWAPNPLFVGRDDDLGRIAAQLKAGGTIAVSTGIGGVGKTQLAIEAAHRYGRYFGGGVFWLSFADPASIMASIADCGRAIGAFHEAEQLDLDAQVQRTLTHWTSDLPRLLIFDNCEDETLLRQCRPATGGCRVLVTSRKQTAWSADLRVTLLPLEVLSRPGSVQLLQRLVPWLITEEADQIAAELGDLPLALHLAGCYLAFYDDMSPQLYVTKLRAVNPLAHWSLQGDGVESMPTDREPHVERAFALSFERLQLEQPMDVLAREALARAACFAPGEPFARAWLADTLEVAGDVEDQMRVRTKAIKRLLSLGLLEQVADDTLRLHRLLAAYAVRAIADPNALSLVEWTVLQVAGAANQGGVPQDMLMALPHLRYLVSKALEAQREDLVASTLYNNLGFYNSKMGYYQEALHLHFQALAIRERFLDGNNILAATSLNNLAAIYIAQGMYGLAFPLVVRSHALYESLLGEDHPSVLMALNNIAEVHRLQGVYDKAMVLMKRVVDKRKQVLGVHHPDVAESVNSLALIYQALDLYDQAIVCYEEALAIHKQAQGEEHPDTARVLNNIADLRRMQGMCDEAERLHLRALEIRRKVFGDIHPDVAQSLNNLSQVHDVQGKYSEALQLLEQSLIINRKVFGSNHIYVAGCLNNIAGIYMIQGSDRQAQRLIEEAKDIYEQTLGSDHPDTALCLYNLAILYERQGLLEEAIPLMEQAWIVRNQRLGADHPATERAARILKVLRDNAMVATLPQAIQVAMQTQDVPGFLNALQALPPDEAKRVIQRLKDAGVQGLPD